MPRAIFLNVRFGLSALILAAKFKLPCKVTLLKYTSIFSLSNFSGMSSMKMHKFSIPCSVEMKMST